MITLYLENLRDVPWNPVDGVRRPLHQTSFCRFLFGPFTCNTHWAILFAFFGHFWDMDHTLISIQHLYTRRNEIRVKKIWDKKIWLSLQRKQNMFWLENTPWVVFKKELDLTLLHHEGSLITQVFIKVIRVNHYMDILRMPQIYLNPLPVDCELCTLLILKLNGSWGENFNDDE